MIELPFRDRYDAGRLLGAELARRNWPPNTIVLALPRGGVPVGAKVADSLQVPLDVLVVRKLGVPWQPELAMGAVAGGSVTVVDELVHALRISPDEVAAVITRERAECERRENLYRAGRPAPDLKEARTVLLVDDGLATGSTMVAAVRYVRSFKPKRTIVAVPVASQEACRRLSEEADQCLCLAMPESFRALGEWYLDFRQVSDSEVRYSMEKANRGENVSAADRD